MSSTNNNNNNQPATAVPAAGSGYASFMEYQREEREKKAKKEAEDRAKVEQLQRDERIKASTAAPSRPAGAAATPSASTTPIPPTTQTPAASTFGRYSQNPTPSATSQTSAMPQRTFSSYTALMQAYAREDQRDRERERERQAKEAREKEEARLKAAASQPSSSASTSPKQSMASPFQRPSVPPSPTNSNRTLSNAPTPNQSNVKPPSASPQPQPRTTTGSQSIFGSLGAARALPSPFESGSRDKERSSSMNEGNQPQIGHHRAGSATSTTSAREALSSSLKSPEDRSKPSVSRPWGGYGANDPQKSPVARPASTTSSATGGVGSNTNATALSPKAATATPSGIGGSAPSKPITGSYPYPSYGGPQPGTLAYQVQQAHARQLREAEERKRAEEARLKAATPSAASAGAAPASGVGAGSATAPHGSFSYYTWSERERERVAREKREKERIEKERQAVYDENRRLMLEREKKAEEEAARQRAARVHQQQQQQQQKYQQREAAMLEAERIVSLAASTRTDSVNAVKPKISDTVLSASAGTSILSQVAPSREPRPYEYRAEPLPHHPPSTQTQAQAQAASAARDSRDYNYLPREKRGRMDAAVDDARRGSVSKKRKKEETSNHHHNHGHSHHSSAQTQQAPIAKRPERDWSLLTETKRKFHPINNKQINDWMTEFTQSVRDKKRIERFMNNVIYTGPEFTIAKLGLSTAESDSWEGGVVFVKISPSFLGTGFVPKSKQKAVFENNYGTSTGLGLSGLLSGNSSAITKDGGGVNKSTDQEWKLKNEEGFDKLKPENWYSCRERRQVLFGEDSSLSRDREKGEEEWYTWGNIWGTEVYSDDSALGDMLIHGGWIRWVDIPDSVLQSDVEKTKNDGLHAGSISADEKAKMEEEEKKRKAISEEREYGKDGLEVRLRIIPPLIRYIPGNRNGIRSRAWGNGHDGWSLVVEQVKRIKNYHNTVTKKSGRKALKYRLQQNAMLRKACLDEKKEEIKIGLKSDIGYKYNPKLLQGWLSLSEGDQCLWRSDLELCSADDKYRIATITKPGITPILLDLAQRLASPSSASSTDHKFKTTATSKSNDSSSDDLETEKVIATSISPAEFHFIDEGLVVRTSSEENKGVFLKVDTYKWIRRPEGNRYEGSESGSEDEQQGQEVPKPEVDV